MPAETNGFPLHGLLRKWGPYAAKACAAFVALCLLGRFLAVLPPAGVAIAWAALSALVGVSFAYHAVIRKAQRQFVLKSGGLLARMNGRRTLSLVVSFVAAAVCVAGVLLEAPKWSLAVWVALAFAVLLYPAVYARVLAAFQSEIEPLFQSSKAMLLSNALVCVALCLVYLLLCALEPVGSYANATEAYLAVNQPLAASPSALLAQVGKVVALADVVTVYGMAKVAEVSLWLYLAWRVAICAAAFLGFASLLNACALRAPELRRVFLPLDAMRDEQERHPLVLRYVVAGCLLPPLLAVGYLYADFRVAEVCETQQYTAAESFVRDHVGYAVRVFDGAFYDEAESAALMQEAIAASDTLREEREAVLVPLVNAAFDKRVENVDAYLDWYYSLPADYERLLQYFSGTVESGMQEQLLNRINEGVDESEFSEKANYYMEQSQQIVDNLRQRLEDCKVTDIPTWLLVPTETLDSDFLDGPLAPTQRFLDAGGRMGLSAGVGAIAGVISAKVAKRIMAKPVFKKIVAGLLEKLAMRGLLAAGGTAIAPGVGTAVGVGVGVAADYLLLKADEVANRAAYREELVAAIEESRSKVLEVVCAG